MKKESTVLAIRISKMLKKKLDKIAKEKTARGENTTVNGLINSALVKEYVVNY